MKKHFFFLLFFIAVSLSGFGQGYLTLAGKVIDKTTQTPLANVHVGMKGRGVGTVTNDEGQFLLRFPRIIADSTMAVAALGYRTFYQKASTFQPNQKDIIVQLETARPQVVDSAFIKRFDARGLLLGALAKVKANASAQPYLTAGFYTETLQQNGEYIEIKEATIQTEKDPRPKAEVPEKVKLVRGRMFHSQNRASLLEGFSFPNGASIVTHSIDIALPEYLENKNLYDYNYQIDDTITYFLNKSVYRVRFWPINNNIRGARNGIISINEADSAIVRIEYDFMPSGMGEILKTSMMDKVFGKAKREPKRLYTCISYVPVQGKWYLKDYRLMLNMQFEQAKTQILGSIRLQYVMTDLQKSNGARIAEADVLLNTDEFPAQAIPKYDENGWGVFNYIMATNAMKLIINTLEK